MLDVDSGCWEPPDIVDVPGWLEEVMLGVTTGKSSKRPKDPPSYAVMEARTIVLEVVVDYLVAGRRELSSIPPPPLQDRPGPTAAVSTRALQFFPQKEKGKPRKTWKKSTQLQKEAELALLDTRNAVETSAAWAVGVWGLAVEVTDGEAGAGTGEGAGAGAPQNGRRRRRRRESPALIRARLLATRLLAEVVETCGLPVHEACEAIRDQMNSFSGAPGVAVAGAGAAKGGAGPREPAAAAAAGRAAALGAAGAQEAGCRGLGAAARGGLVRALLGRPFCPELARVLREDLGVAGDGYTREDAGGVGRLRALLSRVLQRAQGGAEPDLLLCRYVGKR